MRRFKPKDVVRITSQKSKNRGAIGIVEEYCHGDYETICRVRLSDRKTINIFDRGLELFTVESP